MSYGLPYLVTKKQYGLQWRCHLRGEFDKEDRLGCQEQAWEDC